MEINQVDCKREVEVFVDGDIVGAVGEGSHNVYGSVACRIFMVVSRVGYL